MPILHKTLSSKNIFENKKYWSKKKKIDFLISFCFISSSFFFFFCQLKKTLHYRSNRSNVLTYELKQRYDFDIFKLESRNLSDVENVLIFFFFFFENTVNLSRIENILNLFHIENISNLSHVEKPFSCWESNKPLLCREYSKKFLMSMIYQIFLISRNFVREPLTVAWYLCFFLSWW